MPQEKELDMAWYKFTISNEHIAPIVAQKIQERFNQIFWSVPCPKGAAVYAKKNRRKGAVQFFT